MTVWIVSDSRFNAFIVTVILANAVLVGLETSEDLLARYGDVLELVNTAIIIVFIAEITIRMASTNAIHRSREAVDFAYNAAGATAIFENHPLERRFRDIHTVTQQLQGRLSHFETVGAWMLGADADLTFV